MAYATAESVARRLKLIRAGEPLTADEKEGVEEFLDDIEADIIGQHPDILSDLDPRRRRNLLKAECAAVIRVIRNPNGLRQFSVTSDDYTESGSVGSGVNLEDMLYLTAAEWASLAPAGTSTSESFSIRLGCQ